MQHETMSTTDARLSTHEAVCAERYANILSRMGRVETLMIATAGAIILGMASLIITLVFKAG